LDELGGAVRSGHITAPGCLSDLFSAFYPLSYASPVIAALARIKSQPAQRRAS
jgi:hypothetical protein